VTNPICGEWTATASSVSQSCSRFDGRAFLYTTPLALVPVLPRGCDEVLHDYVSSDAPFLRGVASGDPLPHAVVIWTRETAT
jgi:phosphodiesterase/alkaline phosphatase D-like protein